MMLFVVLLRCFICVKTIKTYKIDLISQIYQIIIISIFNNCNYRYFNNYFIKFIGFMLIYYVINLIVSSYMDFSHLYLGFIVLL